MEINKMATYLSKVGVVEKADRISLTRFAREDMVKYNYSDEDLFIAYYMNKIFPGAEYTVIDDKDVPKKNGAWDKSERYAWALDKGTKKVKRSASR
jgi:hypothetical protein